MWLCVCVCFTFCYARKAWQKVEYIWRGAAKASASAYVHICWAPLNQRKLDSIKRLRSDKTCCRYRLLSYTIVHKYRWEAWLVLFFILIAILDYIHSLFLSLSITNSCFMVLINDFILCLTEQWRELVVHFHRNVWVYVWMGERMHVVNSVSA